MAEWFKASVLKTDVGVSLPWVRIPPLPPLQDRFVFFEINETVIVIGPCSHRVDPDVKEAGGRVRSQLTVGGISSVGVAVKHTRLSSVENIGSNPIRRTKSDGL